MLSHWHLRSSSAGGLGRACWLTNYSFSCPLRRRLPIGSCAPLWSHSSTWRAVCTRNLSWLATRWTWWQPRISTTHCLIRQVSGHYVASHGESSSHECKWTRVGLERYKTAVKSSCLAYKKEALLHIVCFSWNYPRMKINNIQEAPFPIWIERKG